jgi:hypothetical protein
MTAAGIAFIAGGLATLVSLRSVLFGGGKRRRDRPAEAAEQRPAVATSARRDKADRPDKPRRQDSAKPRGQDSAKPRGRVDKPRGREGGRPNPGVGRDDEPGSLAAIGLADEAGHDPADEPGYEPDYEADHDADYEPVEASERAHGEPPPIEVETPVVVTADDEASRPISVRRMDRSDRRYGDRVAGWVRPEYHDDPPPSPSGEYWTPVPMPDLGFDLAADDPEPSAKGYGWPIQVERLPAVPDYEPATGFDLTPVPAEPTEAVPIWSPNRRGRSPREWTGRNEKPDGWTGRNEKPGDNRFLENEPGPGRRKNHDEADQRFRAPIVEPQRRRPRPRPRPAPDPNDVYVSRHAADPPP